MSLAVKSCGALGRDVLSLLPFRLQFLRRLGLRDAGHALLLHPSLRSVVREDFVRATRTHLRAVCARFALADVMRLQPCKAVGDGYTSNCC